MQHVIPELDAKGLRQFAITTSVIVCLLFGLLIPYLFSLAWPRWPWIFAIVFIVWGLLIPKTLNPIYKIWMRFGLIMGKITTPLILGILFFLIMTPMGILVRLFKEDPMARKLDLDKETYRVVKEDNETTDFERPF
ncbi:MAG: SxtJ family membrane protein [Pseudomonadota bacterium]